MPNTGKDVEQLDLSYIDFRNINGIAMLEYNFAASVMTNIQTPYPPLPNLLPTKQQQKLKFDLFLNILISFIFSSPKLEIMQISIRW